MLFLSIYPLGSSPFYLPLGADGMNKITAIFGPDIIKNRDLPGIGQ
jgi:hypothetical protein